MKNIYGLVVLGRERVFFWVVRLQFSFNPMDKLTDSQKTEMFRYMEQHQDTNFKIIAKIFSIHFKTALTKAECKEFYMNKLLGV